MWLDDRATEVNRRGFLCAVLALPALAQSSNNMTSVEQIAAWDEIWRERSRRLAWLRAVPSRWDELREYYKTHLADWVSDWGVTVDPRNVRKGLPTTMPFVLDPKQREWCDFTYQNWRDGVYAGSEKSRDVGLSWLLVGMSCGWATLYDGFIVGWGSFKSDKVDESGNLGSLFEKGRNYMDGLPEELRAGFDARSTSLTRRLLFPGTGSSIIGEIGDNVGRGNRTSIYFVDEAAYFEHDQVVDAALSKTTDCRQDVSSVHGMLNTFAGRMHDGKSRKFTFHWRNNPRFTQEDYDEFLEQWGSVITAQELDINYAASLEGIVIPAEWVNAAIDAHVVLGIEPTGERSGSFDVADRGIDKNAFAARHGIVLTHAEQWSGQATGDIYASVERIFKLCDAHQCDSFKYDADGLGAGVRGDARKINEERAKRRQKTLRVQAFIGSGELMRPEAEDVLGRKNKDFFENLKAQAWWAFRFRFQRTFRAVQAQKAGKPISFNASDIISIAGEFKDLARLCVELSQPVYTQSKSGKLLIDKTPDGVSSPNLADAAMMLYAPLRRLVFSDEYMRQSKRLDRETA